jgi:hypothetical protein
MTIGRLKKEPIGSGLMALQSVLTALLGTATFLRKVVMYKYAT